MFIAVTGYFVLMIVMFGVAAFDFIHGGPDAYGVFALILAMAFGFRMADLTREEDD